MADNVERIKEKLSIEEVVSWYVQLKSAGSSMKARCPFHTEKTPSFTVSPLRGTYHCFGCGVGGDMFSFVQAIEGVDFKGALVMLAEKAGVTLAYDAHAQTTDKDVLYAIVKDAQVFFKSNLEHYEPACEYLFARGLSEETLQKFELGFAPDSWDALYTHLQSKKYTDTQIERSGLIKKSEKGTGYYDRFRSRIMFPINDSVGRPVGFSGRAFASSYSKPEENEVAKYINSPESELYNKSSILFGFDRAKQAIRRNNFAVLVEGQMDLLLSHQIKYANTVALSGTALTEHHVRSIGRLTKNLVIALDSDTAGIDATRKSARAGLLAGFDVKVTHLPDGKDPADIISQQGVDTWKESIKNAQHIIPFLFGYIRAQSTDDRMFALRATKEVLPFITYIESPVDRAHFIRLSARELSVNEQVIELEISRIKERSPLELEQDVSMHYSAQKNVTSAQEHAIQFLRWREHAGSGARIRAELERVLGASILSEWLEQFPERTDTFFVMEEMYDLKNIDTIEYDVVHRLEREVLESRVQEATALLKKAEAVNDNKAIQQAISACEEARKAMSAFQGRG